STCFAPPASSPSSRAGIGAGGWIFCVRTGFFSPPRPPSGSALKKATPFPSRWACACFRCRSPGCWARPAASDLRSSTSARRRRAQLALLRVLGLTRRELVAMLLAEAAIVGAMGALAGIALGHASAAFVLERFGAELGGGYFRGLAPSAVLDWPALALFFSLGIFAAVLGSLAPALEAAGAEPAPALKAGDEE